FPAREQAMRELTRLEGQAEPGLRRALEAKPSPEGEKRLKTLLERLGAEPSAGPALRGGRGGGILGQAVKHEARRLLGEVSRGAPGARLTEEAKTALRRLAKRVNADKD